MMIDPHQWREVDPCELQEMPRAELERRYLLARLNLRLLMARAVEAEQRPGAMLHPPARLTLVKSEGDHHE